MDERRFERVQIVQRAADLNGDGIVNVTDMLALLGAWGVCE